MTVEDLLKEKKIDYTPQGKDFLVSCFNPEHDDSSPSTRIDKVSGVFNCLSCGYKGNFFDLCNEVRDYKNELVYNIQRKIRDIMSSTVGLSIPEGAVPFSRNFRDIKGKTFRELEAFTHGDYEDRIVFPVRSINGNIVAFCARHIYSDARPKYIVDPPEVVMPLYPAKVSPHFGDIIMVEGIFDYINLLDKGITNACCMFGTRTMSVNNIDEKLMPVLLAGTSSITMLLDGDNAGNSSAEELKDLIQKRTRLVVRVYNLGKDIDPGSLNQEQVSFLKQDLYNSKEI